MKTLCHIFSVLLAFFAIAQCEDVRVRQTSVGIEIETGTLRQVLRCSSETSSVVELQSIYLKSRHRELLAAVKASPWFELCVNDSLVTSAQPVWKLLSHSRDPLDNGGTAVRLVFVREDGLQVAVVMQVFPGSTLCRQRLEVSGEQGKFHFSRHLNRVHLVFPSYSFTAVGQSLVNVDEVRLASWLGENDEAGEQHLASEDRPDEPAARLGKNLRQNYMYHPVRKHWDLKRGDQMILSGQVAFARGTIPQPGIMMAYEHDSPGSDTTSRCCVIDASRTKAGFDLRYRIQDGAYADRESIGSNVPFTTAWVTVGVYDGGGDRGGEALLKELLRFWITDNPASRQPQFYYNTWGMQRDESLKGKDVRGVLTEARAREEARYAAEMGVDLFVLDDGWQEHFGDWTAHPAKFPGGLAPLRQELDSLGLVFGIWLGSLAVDSNSAIATQHPEWFIRDGSGKPIRGRWDRNVMCMVSGYHKYFIDVCKRLIDQGARYFKWDGLDSHTCSSAAHLHGDASCSEAERIARQRYEFIRFVTAAAHELHTYMKGVVVEFDVTEPNRSVGLTFLSEGKFFWMNNGASWYGDHSTYRAKSTRAVASGYASLFPLGLQTNASYPHQHATYNSQRYNVNSSLIWGRGFWGDLSKMSASERRSVGEIVALVKRVTPSLLSATPEIHGKIGASPEIYSFVDRKTAEGALVAFSGSAVRFDHQIKGVRTDSLLAVVRNPFRIESNSVTIPFEFSMPDVSREAFLISNRGTGICIVASTGWIKDAQIAASCALRFSAARGTHRVRWNVRNGIPGIVSTPESAVSITHSARRKEYIIEVTTHDPTTQVEIRGDTSGPAPRKSP